MKKLFSIILTCLTTATLLSVGSCAELAAGAPTAGGVVVLPQNNKGGFAGAFGQPVVGVSGDGTLWSGLITPDSATQSGGGGGNNGDISETTDTLWIPENVVGTPGATVSVPIYLKGKVPFAGVQAFLNFDASKLTYSTVSKGALISSDSDWAVEANVVNGNQLRIIASAGLTLKAVLPDESKPLAVVQFQLQPSMTSGTPLDFVDVTKIAASNGDTLPLRILDGSISLGDATPPSVTITTPANASTIFTLPSINGSAQDDVGGSGIARVQVYLLRSVSGSLQYWNSTTQQWQSTSIARDATLENSGALNTNWSISNNLPSGAKLTPGLYYLSAYAFDLMGNFGYSGTKSFTVKTDSVSPTSVAITTPANASTIFTLPSINGSASDDAGGSGIARVQVYLLRSVSGSLQYWNSTTQQWQSTSIARDATLENSGALNTNWSISSSLPSGSKLQPGLYYLSAYAFDLMGNFGYSGTKSFTVKTDSVSPTSVAITTPANASTIFALPSINGSASDDAGGSGIARVQVYLLRSVSGSLQYWNSTTQQWQSASVFRNATLSAPNALNTNWSISNNLPSGSKLTPGLYYLSAYGFDLMGNYGYSGTKSFTVKADAVAPTSVTITNPVNGSAIFTLPSINGSAQDDAGGSGIARVQVYLLRSVSGGVEYWNSTTQQWQSTSTFRNATLSTPNALNTNWSISNNLPSGSKLQPGLYYLSAYGFDLMGNYGYSGTKSFTVKTDSVSPTSVTVTTPANGSTIASLPSINGSASDDASGSGISRVQVYLLRSVSGSVEYWNSTTQQWQSTSTSRNATLSNPNAINTNWSISSNLPSGVNLTSGLYYLSAYAYDGGNNYVYSGTKSFTVNTAGAASPLPSSAVALSEVSASASSSQIVLTFSDALQASDANTASNFAVTIGGTKAMVVSASYAASTHRVTLQLAEGALQGGEVVVGYRDLHDVQGKPLDQAAYTVDAE